MNMIDQPISPDELKNNHNCASLIAERILSHFGFENPSVEIKALEGFGVGLGVGSLCGALSGSLYAINRILENHGVEKDLIDDEVNNFKIQFMKEYGSFECRNIVLEVMEDAPKEMQQDPKQLEFCAHLLNESELKIEELLNYVIAVSNPIMQRYSRM
jgi:C_GCAxxG_C_C family probable redox protein